MEQTKRKIGDYTVLTSFPIGEYEIALCEDPEAPREEVYLCGYIENNGLFERLTDCMVSDSYAEIATFYGERIAEKSEEVQKEIEGILRKVEGDREISANACKRVSYDESIEGKVIVLRGDVLRPEYRRSTSQLLLCTGGFGAQANARGRTCFATRLYDGQKTQCQRDDVLGVMPEELLPEWARTSLESLRREAKRETRGER